MNQAEFDNLVMALAVGSAALGGVILVALLMTGWRRYPLAALFGLLAAVLLEPVFLGGMADPTPLRANLLSLVVCVGGAILALTFAEMFLEKLLSDIRTGAPKVLVPENWTGMGNAAASSPRDHVRRWFVAIAAATGAVVGAVLGIDLFWDTLTPPSSRAASCSPSSLSGFRCS